MRKITMVFIVFGWLVATFGQVKDGDPRAIDTKHEIKANVFNVVIIQAIDINYEYLINENSAIGLGVFQKYLIKEIEQEYWFTFEMVDNRKFAISPYFRRYFSKGLANGFFVEGFSMLHSGREANFDIKQNYDAEGKPTGTFTEVRTYESYTRFAIGFSLGGKILLKKGFLLEFYTGVGASPFDRFFDMVTRGGLSLGYRFQTSQ